MLRNINDALRIYEIHSFNTIPYFHSLYVTRTVSYMYNTHDLEINWLNAVTVCHLYFDDIAKDKHTTNYIHIQTSISFFKKLEVRLASTISCTRVPHMMTYVSKSLN